jgi:hypothetical protein
MLRDGHCEAIQPVAHRYLPNMDLRQDPAGVVTAEKLPRSVTGELRRLQGALGAIELSRGGRDRRSCKRPAFGFVSQLQFAKSMREALETQDEIGMRASLSGIRQSHRPDKVCQLVNERLLSVKQLRKLPV